MTKMHFGNYSRFGSMFPPRQNRSMHTLLTLMLAVTVFAGLSMAHPTVASELTSVEATTDDAATSASAAIDPISVRFASEDIDERPDFQRHVVPLLGRLGCNGRACHGSFQGRGGFQLSLFGYDFQTDHDQLLDENTGRVDVDDIDESLILSKPSDADMHEGGKRFELGSWQHHVLRQWIAEGAAFEASEVQSLQRLEVSPAEIQFDEDDQEVTLRVVAHWPDGTSEDVTDLCRFDSNDESIAAVDENGLVQSGDRGDTHVVVFYDNAVVPVPVLRPIATPTHVAPTIDNPVDRLVQQKLDKLGVVPSATCSDEAFIRRASLDITGVLPSAARVREFLADSRPDRRDRLVEELLQSPGYAAWWATRMSDWTGNSDEQLVNSMPLPGLASKLWYEWLRERLQQNVPYDDIIEGIVTADNREPGESYLQYCETMTEVCQGQTDMFTERSGLPMYWGRRNFQKPEERAIGFAYTFLGVRIECAQCHKHPFDQWSKNDFEEFADLFTPIRAGNIAQVRPESKSDQKRLTDEILGDKKLKGGQLRRAIGEAAKDGKVVPFGEILINVRKPNAKFLARQRQAKKKGLKIAPPRVPTGKILGVDEEVALDDDPRPALMRWLRDPENPYFAKAIVNRVWDNYFGIGIVNPTDDMNLANPPSNAALLDYLAEGLIENDFDLKWLHREIVSSDTYQRSVDVNETNQHDRVNFARHIPRRLPAEVVYDMVLLATGSDARASALRTQMTQMAVADGKPRKRNRADFALEVFGQSIRESNCDCDRSDSPSLLQSIYLRNDSEMYGRIADRNGWVAEACDRLGVPKPAGRGRDASAMVAGKLRAAEKTRRQAIVLLQRYLDAGEGQQKRMLPKIEAGYAKMRKRLSDFDVPSLESLLADPEAWDSVQPKTADSKSQSRDTAMRESLGSSNEGQSATSLRDIIDETYLRTLSRQPDADEVEIAMDYIESSTTVASGVEGFVWAVVNTKEFIISH